MKPLASLYAVLCAPALWLAAPPCTAEEGELKQFELFVRDGTVGPDQRTLRVIEGDTVEIVWSTDRAIKLHLHGYDIEASVQPGSIVRMRFDADATGRFAAEAHDADRHGGIVYLEVHPR